MKRLVSSCVAAALVAGASAAAADTPMSRWDRARDPDAYEDEKLHLSAQRMLVQLEIARRLRSDLFDRFTRDLKLSLESWNAASSRDPRLRFDYGQLLEQRGEHLRAIEVLKPALAMAPDHPAAEEAWLRLAFACGHVGDHACERRSYVEVLRLVTEEPSRATPTLNLAETEMHLGNLREAIEGYREALRLAGRTPSRDTAPLAVWGLAVALDRSGDRVSGEKEARFARELEKSSGVRSLLRSTNVFFVPAYEIHWYEGLGASAEARVEPSPAKAVALWREAEQSFEAYVRAAERTSIAAGAEKPREKDRWLDLARARLKDIKAERARAEKRRGKEPVPESAADEDVQL